MPYPTAKITELFRSNQDYDETVQKLERQNWILNVERFCKMEPNNEDYDKTYKSLINEFYSLGLGADQHGESDQQKTSDVKKLSDGQKNLLNLHSSYLQAQIDRGNYDLAKEASTIPDLIQNWKNEDAAEWRLAYRLWCTVLRGKGDEAVKGLMDDIWPRGMMQKNSKEVKLWKLQMGEELCSFLGDDDEGIRHREYLWDDRKKVQTELHDDTIQAGLSLAQSYLKHARATVSSQIRSSNELETLTQKSKAILVEIWSKNGQLPKLTSTILRVGQELGCLIYKESLWKSAKEARGVLEVVWKAKKARLPEDLQGTLLTGHYLFLTYAHLKLYREAKPIFQEVWQTVNFMRKSIPDNSVLNVYYLLTDFLGQESVAGARQGAATELFGSRGDDDQSKLCVAIGMVLLEDEKYYEAESILRRADNIYKTSGLLESRNDEDALACERSLARAVAEQKRFSEAVEIFEKVLPVGESEKLSPPEKEELNQYYGDVWMKLVNDCVSRSEEIRHLYSKAIEVSFRTVHNVLQKPQMHTCARYLLLELAGSGDSQDAQEADALLHQILKYPEDISQQILSYSFLGKLGESARKGESFPLAIKVFKMLMKPPKGVQQERLGTQEVSVDLGFCLAHENERADALAVLKDATKALSTARKTIDAECRKVNDPQMPSLILPQSGTSTPKTKSRQQPRPIITHGLSRSADWRNGGLTSGSPATSSLHLSPNSPIGHVRSISLSNSSGGYNQPRSDGSSTGSCRQQPSSSGRSERVTFWPISSRKR